MSRLESWLRDLLVRLETEQRGAGRLTRDDLDEIILELKYYIDFVLPKISA
jgi:hypothetical protein